MKLLGQGWILYQLLRQNGRLFLRLERLEATFDRARTAPLAVVGGAVALEESLDNLGVKYQTDKASDGHNYLVHYDELLTPMRKEHIDVLEIGVWAGSSICMWHEYFPAARTFWMALDLFIDPQTSERRLRGDAIDRHRTK